MSWVLAIVLAPIVAGLVMAGVPLIWAVVIVFSVFVFVARAVGGKR